MEVSASKLTTSQEGLVESEVSIDSSSKHRGLCYNSCIVFEVAEVFF